MVRKWSVLARAVAPPFGRPAKECALLKSFFYLGEIVDEDRAHLTYTRLIAGVQNRSFCYGRPA